MHETNSTLDQQVHLLYRLGGACGLLWVLVTLFSLLYFGSVLGPSSNDTATELETWSAVPENIRLVGWLIPLAVVLLPPFFVALFRALQRAGADYAWLGLTYFLLFSGVFMAFSASESTLDFALGRFYGTGTAEEQALALLLAETVRAWIEVVLRVVIWLLWSFGVLAFSLSMRVTNAFSPWLPRLGVAAAVIAVSGLLSGLFPVLRPLMLLGSLALFAWVFVASWKLVRWPTAAEG